MPIKFARKNFHFGKIFCGQIERQAGNLLCGNYTLSKNNAGVTHLA
jgi:hypothetical protein